MAVWSSATWSATLRMIAAHLPVGIWTGPPSSTSHSWTKISDQDSGSPRNPAPAGIWLLLASHAFIALAPILYGAGNGIHTIARGALPLVLFDPHQYAALMGKLATPSLIIQAAAPSIGALLLGMGGGQLVLIVLAVAATLNVGLCASLVAAVRR